VARAGLQARTRENDGCVEIAGPYYGTDPAEIDGPALKTLALQELRAISDLGEYAYQLVSRVCAILEPRNDCQNFLLPA
jgi:hypothetical protein